MKQKFILIVYPIILSSMVMAYNAFGIGISGLNILQSATFYNNNIYYGADFLHFAVNTSTETTTDYIGYGNDEFSSSDGELSVNLFMPRLGFRKPYKKMGSLQNYNQIEGYIIIPMLKTSGDLKIDSDTENEVKDALELMGFKASHSVEYNFTEQLALVAEVGINWIFWEFSQSDENDYSSYTEKTQNALNTNLSMTYTKLSLHFKFKEKASKELDKLFD